MIPAKDGSESSIAPQFHWKQYQNKHIKYTCQAFVPKSQTQKPSELYCKNIWISKSSAGKMKRQIDRNRTDMKLGINSQDLRQKSQIDIFIQFFHLKELRAG